jgi:hypothetical protein
MTAVTGIADQERGIKEASTRLARSREEGITWLISRIGEDGEPAGAATLNQYYRLPWALVLAGRAQEASSVLSWMERNALSGSGDLLPGAAQQPWTAGLATYPLSQMALGAWHLERYDTALSIMRTLKSDFQHPETGGAFAERPEHRATGRQDLISTAQLGLAALMTGRRDIADPAYGWMVATFEAQPDLPHRLYTAWDEGGLITEFDPELAFDRVTDFREPRQQFFNPGIGAAFLARYYKQTGEAKALDIARALLALSEGGSAAQFDYTDTVQIGKYAWGLAAVLDVDPDERYVRGLLKMADWFVDSQCEDGRWNPSAFIVPSPGDVDGLWKTAEHIMIMTMMLSALAGQPRG